MTTISFPVAALMSLGYSQAEATALYAQFEAAILSDTDALDATRTTDTQSGFTISVVGDEGTGKTTLLLLIARALASEGLLDAEGEIDGRVDPLALLGRLRTLNEGQIEAIDFAVKNESLAGYQDRLHASVQAELAAQAVRNHPHYAPANPDKEPTTNAAAFIVEVSATEIAQTGWHNALAKATMDAIASPDQLIDADTVSVTIRVTKYAD